MVVNGKVRIMQLYAIVNL